MFSSLHGRIIFVATISLFAFLCVVALTIDRAFRDSAVASVRDRLEAQLYGLLAIADPDETGRLAISDELKEPRFEQPGSGLVAYVVDENGDRVWASPSLLGSSLSTIPWIAQGRTVFVERSDSNSTDDYPFLLGYGVSWEDDSAESIDYTFLIAESVDRFDQQVSVFRRSLINWLSIGAIALLIVQFVVLRWALSPIRQVADDVRRVEHGEIEKLGDSYPTELSLLTRNINQFIFNEKRHLARYRNTLSDLAHSLKTPLTVIRGLDNTDAAVLVEVDRMNKIVEHQLHRAASQGTTTLAAPVLVRPVVDKLLASMGKVYSNKQFETRVDVKEQVRFFGDEGDLYEVLGNLLDNAFKYGGNLVEIAVVEVKPRAGTRSGLRITVANDGAGIPRDQREIVSSRGVRADQERPGQGIGLAVVSDIVNSYGGSLDIRENNGLTEIEVLIGIEIPVDGNNGD